MRWGSKKRRFGKLDPFYSYLPIWTDLKQVFRSCSLTGIGATNRQGRYCALIFSLLNRAVARYARLFLFGYCLSTMRGILFLLMFLPLHYIVYAQKHDNIWLMGFGGGSQSPLDDEYGNMMFDFSQIDRPTIIEKQEFDMNFDVTNSSISDSSGNLLFYTNGEKIYNRQHQLMQNGNGLVEEATGFGYYIAQGVLILNKPDSQRLYYVLNVENYPGNSFGWKLFSNTIDISINNGLGGVVKKRELLIQDSLSFGRITATKHANGKDWWFFVRKLETNILYRGLIQQSGITIDTVRIGGPITDGGGQVTFSPDGRYYIVADDASFSQPAAIHIYDFDRCKGTFSNQRTHFVDSTPNYGIGVAASPDSRYLYVFHTSVAYQYDLTAADIFSTQVLIGEFDGFFSGLYGSYYLYAQTAPDGRIYVGSWLGTFHWHQVNFPNRQGLDCDFVLHSIEFPVYMAEGLPNHPNYRLGPIDDSVCDTLGLDNHPLANFRWEQEGATDLLQIAFTDLSAYEPDNWYWTFGDGISSQDTSPVHLYAQPGIYDVCLIVSNENSADTICRMVNVGMSSTSEEQTEPFVIVVYPNPFSSSFVLRLIGTDCLRGQVKIFDVTGQTVASKTWSGSQLDWGLSGLKAGVYFYEVQTDRGIVKRGKIIKQ